MDEINGVCLGCRATITRPMPDAWQSPAGEIEAPLTDLNGEDAEAMREFPLGLPCPSCGSDQIRITLQSNRHSEREKRWIGRRCIGSNSVSTSAIGISF